MPNRSPKPSSLKIPSKALFSVLLLALLTLSWPSAVRAQTPDPTPTPVVVNPEEALDRLREQLRGVERELETAPPPLAGESTDQVGTIPSYGTSLRRVQAALRRQINLEETLFQIEGQLRSVESELHRVTQHGLDADASTNITALDTLQREANNLSEQLRTQELSLNAARTSLELERRYLSERQALRRRILDQANRQKMEGSVALETERELENAAAAVLASERGVELARTEIAVAESTSRLLEKRLEAVRFKIELVRREFSFTQESLEAQVSELESVRLQLNDRIDSTQTALTDSLSQLEQVEPSVEHEPERNARQAWVDTHRRALDLLEQRLELNLTRQDLWERRYLVHQGLGNQDYPRWRESAESLVSRLSNTREVLESELSRLRADLSELLTDPDKSSSRTVDGWKNLQEEALVVRQKALEEALEVCTETQILAERLLAELTQQTSVVPLHERWRALWRSAVNFWNIELYTLGDSSVTVGKVNIAFFVLILGLSLVGRFTKMVSNRLLSRLPIKESIRANLERLLRYLFILLVCLFALHVVNIPLTIFTFLGGTLAIAVGFGAQNILNNFISGLILMVERPVRVGDLIEVDQTLGFVEEIGARSTRVRGSTGIHIILPNSHLLENRVVNWTLTDNRLRTSVSVGIAYGSPVQLAMDLIKKAVEKAELVQQVPPPIITFDDFGDSSLEFTVYFWVLIDRPIDRRRAETEVRMNIDKFFREHEISIPFPQRDLNFAEPVPVKIVTEGEPRSHDL